MSHSGKDEVSNQVEASCLARIEHVNQLLLSMWEISRILRSEQNPVELCRKVCESLGRTRNYVTVWIGRPDFETNIVEPVAISGIEPNAFLISPITLDDQPTARGPVGSAIRERCTVVFDDLAADPRFAPWRAGVLPSGAMSMAAIPLLHREKMMGVLAVKASKVKAFDDEEVKLLEEIAGEIAHALHGLEDASDLHNVREHLETLVEAMPDAVFFKDGKGRWLVVNSVGKQLFQTDKRSWLGRTDAEMAGDLPELKAVHEACGASDEQAWQAGKLTVGEERILLPDGQELVAEVHKLPLFYPDGCRKGLIAIGRDITDRKRQESKYIRARDFYLNLLENAPALVWRSGTDSKCDWFNAGWLKFTGRKMEQEVGDGWAEGVHPEDLNRCVEHYLESFRQRKSFEMEYRLRRHDGEFRWIVDHGAPFNNLDGTFGGYIGYCYDIHDRRMGEQRIRLLQSAVESAANGVVMTDRIGTIVWANEAFSEMSGYELSELIGKNMRILHSGQHPPEFYRQMWKAILSGENWAGVMNNRRKDGRIYHEEMHVSPVRADGGEITHFVAIKVDITNRLQLENNLRRREEIYSSIVNMAGDAIALWDLEADRFIEFNPAAHNLLGYSRKEFEGFGPGSIDVAFTPEGIRKMTNQILSQGGAVFETRHRHRDGSVRDVRISTAVLRLQGKNYVSAIWTDITDQKIAAEKLRASEALFQNLFNQHKMVKLVIDPLTGSIRNANPAAAAFYGWPVEQLKQKKIQEINVSPGAEVRKLITQAVTGGGLRFETIHRLADQTLRDVEVSTALIAANGETLIYCIINDITERRLADERLRKSQAMFQNLFIQHQVVMAIIDPATGSIRDANPAAVSFYGWSLEQIRRMKISDFSAQPMEVQAALLADVQKGRTGRYESVHRLADNSVRAVEVFVTAIEIDGEKLLYTIIVDITDRKAAEAKVVEINKLLVQSNEELERRVSARTQQLAESEEKIRSMASSANSAIFMTDNNGRIVFWNRMAEHIFGWPASEITGRMAASLLFHDPILPKEDKGSDAGRQRHVASIELIGIRKNSDLFPVELSLSMIKGGGGYMTIGIATDITERKNVERRLREGEQRFRSLFESSSDAIVTLEPSTWKIASANPMAVKLYGTGDSQKLIGCEPWRLSPEYQPDGLRSDEKARAMIQKALDQGSHYFEWMHRRMEDGQDFMASVKLSRMEIEGKVWVQAAVRDITEQKQYESSLKAKAEEIEDLYNHAPCGYHSLDKDGRFLRVNDTELKWLGYSRDELIGRKITDFYNAQSRDLFAKSFPGYTNEKQAVNLKYTFIRKDGTELPALINAMAIFSADGQFLQTRATVVDNTERLETEKAMMESVQATQAANRAKTEFLANISHEIRTPMNAILGYTQLLQHDESLAARARSQIDIIHRSGENLLSLLNSILELSKIEAGQITVQPESFSLIEMLNGVVQLFRERAALGRLSLALQMADNLPRFIEADEGKIRQILANIVSNAIKFTKQGGVIIYTSAVKGDNGDWRLQIKVTDTGIGISEEELPVLFQKFSQTDSGKELLTGTGLGLAISRQLARAMGGDISVTSVLGKGSIFVFEVPFQLAGDTVQLKKTVKKHRWRLAQNAPPCHVFVVDDIETNQNLLRRVLESSGFVVHSFSGGQEMLSALAAQQPQLVLMDIRMPEMDGLETTRRLRAAPGGDIVKVIAVSASAFNEDRDAAFAAGADDFLAKPFDNDILLEKVCRLSGAKLGKFASHQGKEFDTSQTRKPVQPAELAVLPMDLRNRLKESLQLADFDGVHRLLAEAGEIDRGLALRLGRLAEQFDAERMLQLIEAASR